MKTETSLRNRGTLWLITCDWPVINTNPNQASASFITQTLIKIYKMNFIFHYWISVFVLSSSPRRGLHIPSFCQRFLPAKKGVFPSQRLQNTCLCLNLVTDSINSSGKKRTFEGLLHNQNLFCHQMSLLLLKDSGIKASPFKPVRYVHLLYSGRSKNESKWIAPKRYLCIDVHYLWIKDKIISIMLSICSLTAINSV